MKPKTIQASSIITSNLPQQGEPHPYLDDDLLRDIDAYIDASDLPSSLKALPEAREVCRAGAFLQWELFKEGCPEEDMAFFLEKAGKLSQTKDIWEAHFEVLSDYQSKSHLVCLN